MGDNMLKEYRVKKGLTLEKLAELCNISWRNLHRIENGKINDAKFGTIKKIFSVLDLTNEEILKIIKDL